MNLPELLASRAPTGYEPDETMYSELTKLRGSPYYALYEAAYDAIVDECSCPDARAVLAVSAVLRALEENRSEISQIAHVAHRLARYPKR